jgi:hypothetical protein
MLNENGSQYHSQVRRIPIDVRLSSGDLPDFPGKSS